MKSLHDSSPHYDRLRKKRPSLPTTASLRCKGHSLFEGLSGISEDIKSEGNIFCKCPLAWPALRSIIINGLFEFVQRLEKYVIIEVPPQVLEEVADVTASTVRMGVKVDLTDETLSKITNKKEHLNLLKKFKELERELEQLDCIRDQIPKFWPELKRNLCIMILAFNKFVIIPYRCLIERSNCNL